MDARNPNFQSESSSSAQLVEVNGNERVSSPIASGNETKRSEAKRGEAKRREGFSFIHLLPFSLSLFLSLSFFLWVALGEGANWSEHLFTTAGWLNQRTAGGTP